MSSADSANNGTALLEVDNVIVRFGGIVALDGVTFNMKKGDVVGLIGPNGAGKTTCFNCLSRLYTPNEGDVRFEGQSILGMPPHKIAKIGIGRTFQNLALFSTMSVLDNVMIGGHSVTKSDFFSNALRLPWTRKEDKLLEDKAWALLEYLDLQQFAYQTVGGLPFGTQKRIEIARALSSDPKFCC